MKLWPVKYNYIILLNDGFIEVTCIAVANVAVCVSTLSSIAV